jgi:hypothetical protein
MFDNKLKSIPVSELEALIAKVVSDKIGAELEASISNIDFGRSVVSEASFQVRLSTPLKYGKE